MVSRFLQGRRRTLKEHDTNQRECKDASSIFVPFSYFLGSIEESQLVWVRLARQALMTTKVDAVDDAWITFGKQGSGLGLRGGKTPALPDLVEPSRVAAIAHAKVASANAQPPRNPNIDCIGLVQQAR